MQLAERMAIGGTFIVMAGIVGYVAITKPSFPTVMPKPPTMQTGRFADSETIELISVRKGNVIRNVRSTGKNIHGESSVTSRFGFDPVIETIRKTDTIHKHLIEYQIKSANPDPLMVEFRWLDIAGNARRPRTVNDGGCIQEFPDYSRSGSIKECISAKDMIESMTKSAAAPDIVVQIPDGTGGWVSGSGPVWVPEDPHASCFVVVPAWIRNERELKVRFVRCGIPSLEFTVSNPDFRTAKPLTPPSSGTPRKFTHPEFEVELVGVAQSRHYDRFSLLELGIRFRRTRGFEMCWQWESKSVEDELGNQSAAGSRGRFPFPGVGTQVRIHGIAEPTDWHPAELSECMPICDGIIKPDGTLELTDPVTGNTPRINSVKCSVLAESDTESVLRFAAPRDLSCEEVLKAPGDPSIPMVGFSIELDGECTTAEIGALEKRLGKMNHWRIMVFRNEEIRSCNAGFFTGSSTSTALAKLSYNLKVNCVARLKPGDTVKVCLARKIDPVPVSLLFPVSEVQAETR